MIAEVFLKEAEALLAPVSAAEPGGKNPSADERYQELRVEVDKENSPIGEAVRWPRVAELGVEILGKVAKDLLVAAYTGFALYKTRGIHGLAVGVVVLDGLLDRYWDTMFPPAARLKGRGTAVKWLLEHAVTGLASYQPQPADRAAVTALMTAAKQLRGRAREKLGDHVPSFKEFTDQLESILATLPPEEPKPAAVPADIFAQPAASAPAAAPPPVVPPPVVPPTVSSPAPAAPPPPAAPARPTPKDLAGPWLAPIPGPSPGGKDPIEGTEYQTILAEIDKLQSPTGGAISWAAIIQSADTLLKGQAKDLRVTCHQALARFKTGKIEGLALGFAILAEVADAFWDTAFPPASRLRGRAGALRGTLDQIEADLAAYQPQPSDRAALELLLDCTKRLQSVVRARYADQAPNLRLLVQSVEQLLMTVPAPAPPPPPEPPKPAAPPPPPPVAAPPPPPPPQQAQQPAQPQAAAPAQAPKPAATVAVPTGSGAAPMGEIANAAAVDKFLRSTGEELVKLAHALRRARTADPLAYRLLRSGLWIYMAAPPPVRPDGNTAIGGLPEKERTKLDALHGGGKWAELVELAESLLPANRFALDLHRYTAEALKNLGADHEAARGGLLAEVGALLTRLPKITELKDNAGVPLCGDATRAWLDREVLAGKGGGGGGGGAAAAPMVIAAPTPMASGVDEEAIKQIKALLKGGKREEGLRLGAARAQGAVGGRARFLRRLELAEACLDGGDVGLARSLYAGLVGELDRQQLDVWEPELAARCLEGQAKSLPKGQPAEKAAVEVVLGRLAGLDPLRAAALVPKG